jgi:hypothetical protein
VSAEAERPNNEFRQLGFIDEEESKDSGYSLKDKMRGSHADAEKQSAAVLQSLLDQRTRSLLGFVNGDTKQ